MCESEGTRGDEVAGVSARADRASRATNVSVRAAALVALVVRAKAIGVYLLWCVVGYLA